MCALRTIISEDHRVCSKDNFHEPSMSKTDNKFENEIKNCENVTPSTHVDPGII